MEGGEVEGEEVKGGGEREVEVEGGEVEGEEVEGGGEGEVKVEGGGGEGGGEGEVELLIIAVGDVSGKPDWSQELLLMTLGKNIY